MRSPPESVSGWDLQAFATLRSVVRSRGGRVAECDRYLLSEIPPVALAIGRIDRGGERLLEARARTPCRARATRRR